MMLVKALHVLAAVLWVGGMFFAYVVLRPSSVATLEPPARLGLWAAVLSRFFTWVWGAIAVLLASGYWMIFALGGMKAVGMHVHLMHGLGLVMVLLFAHVYFAPFKRLGRAVEAQDWPQGAKQLNIVRLIVAANLVIGVIIVLVASGRGFGL